MSDVVRSTKAAQDEGHRLAAGERESEHLGEPLEGRSLRATAEGRRLPAASGRRSVLQLQRLAGNQAVTRSLRPAPRVQRLITGVDDDMGAADSVDLVTNTVLNQAGLAGAGTGAGIWGQTLQGVQGAGSTLGTAMGTTLSSAIAIGTSAKRLSEESEEVEKAEKLSQSTDANEKAQGERLLRAHGRKKNIATGDVAQNTANTVGGVGQTVSGGIGLAGSLASQTSSIAAAGNVAGVVGGAIAAPLNLYTMIRQSRRAELQRQRIGRLEDHAKSQELLKTDPLGQAKTAKEKHTNDLKSAQDEKVKAERARDVIDEKLKKEQDALTVQGGQVADFEKKLAEEQSKPVPTEAKDKAARDKLLLEIKKELDGWKAKVVKQKAQIQQITDQKKQAEQDVQNAQTKLNDLNQQAGAIDQAVNDAQSSDEQNAMGAMHQKVKDTAGTSRDMPSLKEISDYAIKKNKRGFARRVIGAVAGGVGLAGATVGIASAVEILQGNADLGTTLGIAGAAIGGAAAIAGIGVGIWKAVNFFRKRKKVAERNNQEASYNPFSRKQTDQTEKRKHMATALFHYAVEGSTLQRAEALKILVALDPKGPWVDPRTHQPVPLEGVGQGPNADKDKGNLVAHIMDKMSSGG